MEDSDSEFISTRYTSPMRRSRGTTSSPTRTPDYRHPPKSPIERAHQREIEKISELWEGTQTELRKTDREIKSLEEKRERDHQREVERLNLTIDNLRSQLRSSEREMDEERSTRLRFSSQVQDKDDKIKKLESLLEIRTSMLNAKQQQLQDLSERLTESNEKNHVLVNEIEESRLDAERTTVRMREQLEKTKDELSTVKEARTNRIEMEIRFEQLKNDNKRLTKLLASTGMYKEFLQFSKDKQGIAFIGSGIPESELEGAPSTFSSTLPEDIVDPKTEWKMWVPQDAYDLAKTFQYKHLPSVRDDLFHEFLIKLNEIWRKRELRKVNKLKAKHTDAVRDLRRQMSHKQHYEDVINMERVEYLKKELKKSKSPASQRVVHMESNILDSTLTEVENLSRELHTLKRENKELRRSSFLGTTFNERAHDEAFVEGAAWMGRKILDLSDRMGSKVSDLCLDWQDRLLAESSRPDTTPHKMIRTQGTFLNNLERNIVKFRERLKDIFETVVQALEMGETKHKLKMETSARGYSDDE